MTLGNTECSYTLAKQTNAKLNPLNIKPPKWSNTLKQFVGKLPENCLSVFDHFVGLALKGLICCSDIIKLRVAKNKG